MLHPRPSPRSKTPTCTASNICRQRCCTCIMLSLGRRQRKKGQWWEATPKGKEKPKKWSEDKKTTLGWFLDFLCFSLFFEVFGFLGSLFFCPRKFFVFFRKTLGSFRKVQASSLEARYPAAGCVSKATNLKKHSYSHRTHHKKQQKKRLTNQKSWE